jgi:hypothetical protein
MINNVQAVHLDRKATEDNILSMVQKKGISVQQYNKSVKELSARYREVICKQQLSEIDKYVVIAQVLNTELSDLFVVTES